MRSLSWPTSSPSGGRAPPMLDRISLDSELRALRRDHVFVGFDAYAFRSIALRHFLPRASSIPPPRIPAGRAWSSSPAG